MLTKSAELSDAEAYSAMLAFLEYYWKAMSSEDLGVVLGAAQLVSDRQSADPAAMAVWNRVVADVVKLRATSNDLRGKPEV